MTSPNLIDLDYETEGCDVVLHVMHTIDANELLIIIDGLSLPLRKSTLALIVNSQIVACVVHEPEASKPVTMVYMGGAGNRCDSLVLIKRKALLISVVHSVTLEYFRALTI